MLDLKRFPRNRQRRDEDEYPELHRDWSHCLEIWRKVWIPGPAAQRVRSIRPASSSAQSGGSTKDGVDTSQRQLQLCSREHSDSIREDALGDGHSLRYVRS